MKGFVKLFCWSFVISFLGTLPLGTLNLSVADYSFRMDWSGAIGFALAAVFAEMLIVWVALKAVRQQERFARFSRIFQIVTCAILLFLAVNSLLAAWEMQQFHVSMPLAVLSPVLSGLVLSLINPLNLPFWLGWTAVLRSKKILDDQRRSYNTYIVAIGLGTAGAFFIYGAAGDYLVPMLMKKQVLLNWTVGGVLLITGLWQLYKLFFKKWKPGTA